MDLLPIALLDPRRIARALEDIHTLATVAVRIQDDIHRLAEAADGLLVLGAKADQLLAKVDDVDRRAAELLATAERFSDQLPVARELLDSAALLNTTAATLAAVVEPLQGITERLGRMTDRLPGGRSGR